MMSKNKRRPDATTKNENKSPVDLVVAKIGLTGTIATAIFTLIGVGLTAYFSYLGIQAQVEAPIRATQTAEARAVRLTQAAPTANSTPSGPTQSPTASPSPTETPTPILAESPEQFIRGYFERIGNRLYEETWSMLSEKYKAEKNPTGFERYKAYWNTVAKVEVMQIDITERTTDSAEIIVALLYTFKDGDVVNDKSVFKLVLNDRGTSWLIDE